MSLTICSGFDWREPCRLQVGELVESSRGADASLAIFSTRPLGLRGRVSRQHLMLKRERPSGVRKPTHACSRGSQSLCEPWPKLLTRGSYRGLVKGLLDSI